MKISLRPLLPTETDWEKLTALTLPATAALGAVWIKFHLPLPPCYLKKYTGCPCAGCGATRATVALSRGDIGEALYLNPMTALGFAALLAYWIYSTGIMTTKPGLRLRLDGTSRKTAVGIRVGIGLLIAANWLWVLTHLPESPWRAQ